MMYFRTRGLLLSVAHLLWCQHDAAQLQAMQAFRVPVTVAALSVTDRV